jgi:hypothetical protein
VLSDSAVVPAVPGSDPRYPSHLTVTVVDQ